MEKIRQFKGKLQEIRDAEENCIQLMKGQQIKDRMTLDKFLQASKEFQDKKVVSANFAKMQEQMMPFVYWINRAVQMIKTYCKSLGLKQSQLNLYEALEENSSYTNPYSSLNNHDALIRLTEQMKPDSPMDFFSELEEGKHLK